MTDPAPDHEQTIESLRFRIRRLEAQNDRMREALKPLSDRTLIRKAHTLPDDVTATVTMAQCRAAAEAAKL